MYRSSMGTLDLYQGVLAIYTALYTLYTAAGLGAEPLRELVEKLL